MSTEYNHGNGFLLVELERREINFNDRASLPGLPVRIVGYDRFPRNMMPYCKVGPVSVRRQDVEVGYAASCLWFLYQHWGCSTVLVYFAPSVPWMALT